MGLIKVRVPKKTWLNAVEHYTSFNNGSENVSAGELTTEAVYQEFGMLYQKEPFDEDFHVPSYLFLVAEEDESLVSAFMLRFS